MVVVDLVNDLCKAFWAKLFGKASYLNSHYYYYSSENTVLQTLEGFECNCHVRQENAFFLQWPYTMLSSVPWNSFAFLHGIYYWVPKAEYDSTGQSTIAHWSWPFVFAELDHLGKCEHLSQQHSFLCIHQEHVMSFHCTCAFQIQYFLWNLSAETLAQTC